MKIVIDTNIAAALLLRLSYSDAARTAVARASSLIAPDLIFHEMANLLWRLTTTGTIDSRLAYRVLDEVPTLLSDCIPGRDLLPESFDLAVTLAHPAYDCFFVRTAVCHDALLLTADRRLAKALEDSRIKVRYQLISA
jgi:predicted nucleic acid-binding protein